MRFLGLHSGPHDCNFTITDGSKVNYFKTERMFQKKHHGFKSPQDFLEFLETHIDISNFDSIAFTSTQTTQPSSLEQRYFLRENDKNKMENYPKYNTKIFYINHHLCHNLSIWPLLQTNKLNKNVVLDAGGSWSEVLTVFSKEDILEKKYWSKFLTNPTHEDEILSFSVAIEELGKKWNIKGHHLDLAGKLMSLQSFGEIKKDLYEYSKQFNYHQLHKIWTNIPEKIDTSWLRTAHQATENAYLNLFKKYISKKETYGYSGGTAQNIVLNTKLREWNNKIVIPPHCTDEGASLGAVEFLRLYYKQPEFDNSGFPFWQHDEVKETPTKETIKKVAEQLAQGKIVGWCQGKGEIGPRALGNRSILMRPDIENGKDIINNRVKHREPYRPFGCSVLLEDVNDYFIDGFESPYMLFTMKLKEPERFKSISHVDNTSRPQTVKDGIFAELLYEFKRLTGTSILLNTSLNINGKPIATPKVADTMNKENMGLDVMCIGNNVKIF